MDTNFQNRDVMFQITYGSKLYGTSTPASDTDLKSVYLPLINDMLLNRKLVATKSRVDEFGVAVPDKQSMPDRGIENEYIPFQTFVRDFVKGQTYAVEIAYAILAEGSQAPDAQSMREFEMLKELVELFGNNEVYSMVGFAQKQTFDYVHRGERLNEARKVLDVIIVTMMHFFGDVNQPRLDSKMDNGQFVLDHVSAETGLQLSSTVNNNRTLRTLELNGRSYLETTELSHLLVQLNKLIESYGDRTNAAAEVDVDFKSLSHAVRVYQQSIELLDTGHITFPRLNAAELLHIKQGKADLDFVKAELKRLDAQVLTKMKTTKMRARTPELEAAAEQWLLSKLRELYDLS